MGKIYQQKDRLLAEKWARAFHPGELAEFQAPLYDTRGINPEDLKTFGIYFYERVMPRADILIIRPDEVLLVEIKTDPKLREVQNLLFYRDALTHDEIRRPQIAGKKIRMIFISGKTDVRLKARCSELGIEYQEYYI